MTEQLHFHFSLSCIGEGNGNPLPCSCLENPRDGGAWWAAVSGVAQSWTRLERLSSSSSKQTFLGLYTVYFLLWTFLCWVRCAASGMGCLACAVQGHMQGRGAGCTHRCLIWAPPSGLTSASQYCYLIHPLTLSEVRIFSFLLLGFPDSASGQELTCQWGRQRLRIDSWVGKIPWRRKW